MINRKNSAFTLAEMIIALVAIGVLVVMTLRIVLKQTPDKEKALFKKAYTQLEMNVAELINDEELYPDDRGFANTLSVEDIKRGESYGESETTKYRSVSKSLISVYNQTANLVIKYPDATCDHNAFKELSKEFGDARSPISFASVCAQTASNIELVAQTYPQGSQDYTALLEQADFLQKIAYDKFMHCSVELIDSLNFSPSDVATIKNIRDNTVNTILASYADGVGIKIENSNSETNSKFRDAIKSKLNIFEDNVTCAIAYNYNEYETTDACFMADDGAVYGIPDTDFESENVFSLTQDGDVLKYVPVTVYVNWDKAKKITGRTQFLEEGIIVGVRFNGNMKILEPLNCNDVNFGTKYQKYKHCQVKEYLKSNTIKTTRDKK